METRTSRAWNAGSSFTMTWRECALACQSRHLRKETWEPLLVDGPSALGIRHSRRKEFDRLGGKAWISPLVRRRRLTRRASVLCASGPPGIAAHTVAAVRAVRAGAAGRTPACRTWPAARCARGWRERGAGATARRASRPVGPESREPGGVLRRHVPAEAPIAAFRKRAF